MAGEGWSQGTNRGTDRSSTRAGVEHNTDRGQGLSQQNSSVQDVGPDQEADIVPRIQYTSAPNMCWRFKDQSELHFQM